MNDLQKHIYNIIISILETDGILKRFEDKKNYGNKRIIDNSENEMINKNGYVSKMPKTHSYPSVLV